MSNVIVCDHPLVQHKISLLRDKNTGSKEFRELVQEIAMFMCYEATRDLPLKEVQIETPLALANAKIISGRKVAFVPIMRAGLGMMEGALAVCTATNQTEAPRTSITASCRSISQTARLSFSTRCSLPAAPL